MLSIDKYDIIKKFSEALKPYDINLYLVGGAVRDILLQKDPADFDFAAEVDEKEHRFISENIADIFSCKHDYNDYYHTCKFLIYGCDIDFIMCRREIYKYPGCIPDIYPSNIIEDLRRRDYSANSIAVGLNCFNFGSIFDPLKGIEDINNKRLRVLHSKSFFDDPTRIFRGFKYASRLDFKFDNYTDDLISKSITDGCMSSLKYGRIKQEIDSLLSEENSLTGIEYIKKYIILDYLFDKKIMIESYDNQLYFNMLDQDSKYEVLLCSNSPDILHEIQTAFGLNSRFLNNIDKYINLQSLLNKGDREIYNYLFRNCKNVNDSVLNFLFPEENRINNYVNCRNKIDIDTDELLSIDEKIRNDFLINKKIDYIIKQ